MAVPCDLSDVLDSARRKLVDDGVFTDSQAYLSLDPDEIMTSPPASPFAGITFAAFDQRQDTLHSEQDTDDTPTMEGELVVAIWIRVNLDAPGRDQYLLAKQTIGMSQMIRKVIGSLQQAELENEDGEMIVWRTPTFIGVRQRGRWTRDRSWRRIDVRFNLTFSWLPDVSLGGLLWTDGSNNVILAATDVTLEAA